MAKFSDFPIEFDYEGGFEEEETLGTSSTSTIEEGDHFGDESSGKSEICTEYPILKIRDWPETKTVMELRCKKIFGKRICTKWPIIYRRSCRAEWIIKICYPSSMKIEKEIRECFGAAAAIAVAILLAGGAVMAALTAFKESFIICLKAKAVEAADDVKVSLYQRKTCGPWKKI